MIALDTNVIARFYVDDPSDEEAAIQRPLAKKLFEESKALFVPLTVILELEWVLRAFYEFSAQQVAQVFNHLAGLPHVSIESSAMVLAALQDHLMGLDFADALHLRNSAKCQAFATFDDRKFAKRAMRMKLKPSVIVLKA